VPPITVDPNALSGAGEAIGAVGEEIATAISTLDSALPGGAKSGLDPAGLAFGQTYQQLSQALLDAGAEAVNTGRSVGFGVQMSATNYSRADAASTIGGGESTLTPPDAPAEYSAPAAPSGLGGGVPPPLLWSVIQTIIPDVWPDGDPSALRASATAWQGFASTINGVVGHLTAPSGVVAGQKIPEGGQMTSAISELTKSLTKIASEAGNLATQTKEFADDVENTQNAIRDLMDRVSPSGLWDGITSVFTGDALEELKEVADDIKTVLGDYWRQAEGRRDILQIAMGKVDDAIVSVEKWARREFPRYLGEDVGNALATALDFELTLGQGILAGGVDLVEGIGQFDPTRFAYDPEGATQAWGDLAKSLGEGLLYSTPTGVLLNPGGAVDHWKDKVSDAVHAEDWSSDRPGYGLGKIFFDVGASAVPGGPALRTTKVAADAAGDAADAARRVDVPGGSFDNLTSATQRVEGITQNLENLPTTATPDIPTTATPNPSGPPIPPSLVDAPSAPHVGDTPAPTPRGPDAPTQTPLAPDAPTPYVPDSTPGDRAPVPQSSTPTSTPGHAPDAPPVDRTPAPTPAGTPAHAPAADMPANSPHSAPAPSPSSTPSGSGTPTPAPAMAGHAPEPASVAAHAPSPTAPDGAGGGSSGGSGNGPSGGSYGSGGGDSGGGASGGSGAGDNHSGSGGSSGEYKGGDPSGNSGADSGSSTSPNGGPTDPIHSHEPSGEGWQRLDDDPIDPHYGEPLSEHWEFSHNPADRIDPDVQRLFMDPEAPFGRAPDGHAYTQHEYEERFNRIGPGGQHWQNFPDNAGAVPGTRVAYSDAEVFIEHYGSALDRIGDDKGGYLAIIENGQPASWEARALHVNSLSDPYNAYALNPARLPEGWKIEVSEVGPGLGQPGGSIQVRVLGLDGKSVPVEILDKIGLLS
jgi:hypothetical protein